jgi:DNA invertase Pin-like site-specific DNA recombinase
MSAKSVAVYLRVSSDDQSHASQRLEVERWLDREGIDREKVEWYQDIESGARIGRQDLERLRADVSARRRAVIVVYALDRLSRDYLDGVTLLGHWLRSGARVASVTEPIDLAGELGQAVAGVIFALAAAERRKLLARQKAGIELAKAKGVYRGRARGSTAQSPARAAELRDKGLTPAEIGTALGVSTRTVRRYLECSGHASAQP